MMFIGGKSLALLFSKLSLVNPCILKLYPHGTSGPVNQMVQLHDRLHYLILQCLSSLFKKKKQTKTQTKKNDM